MKILDGPKIPQLCPHNMTRSFCPECKRENAKVLAMKRHPSNSRPNGDAA